jgi:hypothetical protein
MSTVPVSDDPSTSGREDPTPQATSNPEVTPEPTNPDGPGTQETQAELQALGRSQTLPDLRKVLITFEAVIQGQRTPCLIDCGASEDFIDRGLVTQFDLPTEKGEKMTVTLGDGRKQDASFVAKGVPVQLGVDYKCVRNMTVTPLGVFGIILGKPWLSDVNPSVDWRTNTLTFEVDGAPVVL